MIFDTAMFMGVWVLLLLNIASSWFSVASTIIVALLRTPLHYWQSLIDPYME